MARVRRLVNLKPVKAASSEHGLKAFRARASAAGVTGSTKTRLKYSIKVAKARKTRFQIKSIKHSVALERG